MDKKWNLDEIRSVLSGFRFVKVSLSTFWSVIHYIIPRTNRTEDSQSEV